MNEQMKTSLTLLGLSITSYFGSLSAITKRFSLLLYILSVFFVISAIFYACLAVKETHSKFKKLSKK